MNWEAMTLGQLAGEAAAGRLPASVMAEFQAVTSDLREAISCGLAADQPDELAVRVKPSVEEIVNAFARLPESSKLAQHIKLMDEYTSRQSGLDTQQILAMKQWQEEEARLADLMKGYLSAADVIDESTGMLVEQWTGRAADSLSSVLTPVMQKILLGATLYAEDKLGAVVRAAWDNRVSPFLWESARQTFHDALAGITSSASENLGASIGAWVQNNGLSETMSSFARWEEDFSKTLTAGIAMEFENPFAEVVSTAGMRRMWSQGQDDYVYAPSSVMKMPAVYESERRFLELPLERSERIPSGGILCAELVVRNGTIGHIAEVFSDEFGRAKTPLCHLQLLSGEAGYWYIIVFNGERADAVGLVTIMDGDVRKEQFDACEMWEKQTKRIGYVQVSERPNTPVRFFTFEQEDAKQIVNLSQKVEMGLGEWGFDVFHRGQKDDSPIPDGASQLTDLGKMMVNDTVDAVFDWLRSYLLSIKQVAASISLQQKTMHDGHVRIQYNYENCVIFINAAVIVSMQTMLNGEIRCWQENETERQTAMQGAREHFADLIQRLKKDKRWEPVKPVSKDDRDAWFAYYDERQLAGGISYTLEDLAKELHLARGTVRNLRTEYLAEHRR